METQKKYLEKTNRIMKFVGSILEGSVLYT